MDGRHHRSRFSHLGLLPPARYWYLGGIVPAIWLILLAFLGVHGLIHPAQNWPMLVFPTVILLLLWLKGHETAKKKEIARMKARDLS